MLDLYQETLKLEHLLKQTSRKYSEEEMRQIFSLYNLWNPQNQKTDTGCGSCRRRVLNFLHEKYLEIHV